MNWPKVKLDSIKAKSKYSLVGGPFGSNLTTRNYVEDGIPVIRGVNLSDDTSFIDDQFVFVDERKADELLPNNAYPGDLIFTQRGTLGQVGMIPQISRFSRYVISQSQMKLTVNPEKAYTPFIYYFFRLPSTIETIKAHTITSGVPHINLGILKDIDLFLPPVNIQKQIVSILLAYDDLIALNQRRIQLLEESARLLYREWFVKLRFPGHESVVVKDGVPEGWNLLLLSDLVDPQYGFTESATADPIGPKFLRGTDINKTSYIDWSLVPYCPIDSIEKDKYRLRRYDVVVIRMADPGKVGIIEDDIDAVFASYLIRMRRKDNRLLPYYLFFFLDSEEYQGFISSASTGATRKTANAKLLTAVKIRLPPYSLQAAFDDFIRPIRDQMNILIKQNSKLREVRDLLLPKLMSGVLDVSRIALPDETYS